MSSPPSTIGRGTTSIWCWVLVPLFTLLAPAAHAVSQDAGSIRGVVYDKDFQSAVSDAQVTLTSDGSNHVTDGKGAVLIEGLAPGQYSVVVRKQDFVQQVIQVVVVAGEVARAEVYLEGEYTDLEEYVVQETLQITGDVGQQLMELRANAPALMSSISSDMMKLGGVSDAAGALRLVAGASVQDGKFAVIRGLPDRYVSSQLNGVRLPTADEDKRAVELDQYPASVIESLQISKTFTPDQQGDATGGAVNVKLKGIPDESRFTFSGQLSGNTNHSFGDDFLTYDGGGVDFFGMGAGDRDPQLDLLGESWDGDVGTHRRRAPIDTKWSTSIGGKRELDSGWTVGGFASVFYERDSSYRDDEIDDSLWVTSPGDGMTPRYSQGTPFDGDFKTALFDIDRSSHSVQWGGLGGVGIENRRNAINLTYLYTHNAEDKAILATDTRGKEYYYPGYDPNDDTHPGNNEGRDSAPYLRTETLEYTERTTNTIQLRGDHQLTEEGLELSEDFKFLPPTFDWVLADSGAKMDQPDKRQFGALWRGPEEGDDEGLWEGFKPGANFTLGNLQRTWKEIEEDSFQYASNLHFPFEQWSGDEGFFKVGSFHDSVDRSFDQDGFANFNNNQFIPGNWDDPWSGFFDGPITASEADVDYEGDLDISALYGMFDLPVSSRVKFIGGVRWEKTDLGIVNDPEEDAFWFPPGSNTQVDLNPGDGDVFFEQSDSLPSLGFVYEATDTITIKGAYSETIARQTFKELTPIIQQEFLGGPVFIGNPDLEISDVENYDLRIDYEPYRGGLWSLSYFHKKIEDPIEYVQVTGDFDYTTPRNYPDGELDRFELELRHDLGHYWESLEGFSVGTNATLIDSVVNLPEDEIAGFDQPNIQAPITSRDMLNAPAHLFNLFVTYERPRAGAQIGLFYTLTGDTLIEGAGQAKGNFVPSVYAESFGTLNFSYSQKLSKNWSLRFQAKNLLNPEIETVYRSEYIGADVTKTSFTRGIDLSLLLSYTLNI